MNSLFIIGIFIQKYTNDIQFLINAVKKLNNTEHNIYINFFTCSYKSEKPTSILQQFLLLNKIFLFNIPYTVIKISNIKDLRKNLEKCKVIFMDNILKNNSITKYLLKQSFLYNIEILCNIKYVANSVIKVFEKDYIGFYDNNNKLFEMSIILKYYLLNNENSINDIGILTTFDWCNTGYRYCKSLLQNDINCDMIKIFPHACFDFGNQYFYITELTEYTNPSNIEIIKKDIPYYHIKIINYKLNKLLILFIEKCKYIYLHAETYIELIDYDYVNKKIIYGCSGHPTRRDPINSSNFLNPKINTTLIQCPDLLNLGLKNDKLVYYGVDHDKLRNVKTTKRILTIGHFSSNPETKGSDIILKCINNIINKYPNRFQLLNNLNIKDYKRHKHHEKTWEKNILRYRKCDIYIETCKPYLNAYGKFLEYNNTKFGEWGNTCLEAAASGCIVITNSLTKNIYLKEYNYNYPLLIANTENQIMYHLENINKMTDIEIHKLKLKFLKWVKDKHSLLQTGKRFKNLLLTNLKQDTYPSYYEFTELNCKIKNNADLDYISLVYLNNIKNTMSFELNNNIFYNGNLCIASMEGNLLLNMDFKNFKNIKKYSHILKNILYHTKNNNHIFTLQLYQKSFNFIIFFILNLNKNTPKMYNHAKSLIYTIKNNSPNSLFLRKCNNNINIINNNLLCNLTNSNNMENLFSKPYFQSKYNFKKQFNNEQEKNYIFDKIIFKN